MVGVREREERERAKMASAVSALGRSDWADMLGLGYECLPTTENSRRFSVTSLLQLDNTEGKANHLSPILDLALNNISGPAN